MKKSLFTLVFGVALLPFIAGAQTAKPAAKPVARPVAKPAAKPAAAVARPAAPAVAAAPTAVARPDSVTGTAPAGVSLSPATPPASPTALKVKAELNPITNKLSVRTDAAGPMRVEVNDGGGRPVLTRNVLVGNKPIELSVGQLAAGTYVVRCTAGEKTGMRLVRLGQ
ncbi:hypothetical protein [uncultured Hymenobacter sp.]|uniref:hypothetical protein n=1 Tax=uncultured Hymenobacter sp. TaxID=170016 RepID=UPI0035CC4483